MSEIKEQCINELKKVLVENSLSSIDNYEVKEEDYFEWEIHDFENFVNSGDDITSPEFSLCGYKWDVQLYSYFGSFIIYLQNKDIKSSDEHICVKTVISFRNCNDTSKFKASTSSLYSFSNTNWDHYSGYKTEISEKEYEEFLNPLIENDKIMVGVYMRIYNNDKLVNHINEIKDLIKLEDNYYEIKGENYYEWAIENWEDIESYSSLSPNFNIGGYEWKLTIYPNEGGYVKFELNNFNSFRLKDDEFFYINYVFSVRNCDDLSYYYAKPSINFKRFSKKEEKITEDKFMKTNELLKVNENTNESYVQNNKVVVGVYIRICTVKELSANNEIKSLIIDDNAYKVRDEKYFEWRIDAWDEFKDGWYYSPDFYGGNYGWYIRLCPDYNGYVHLRLEIHYAFNSREKEHVYANCVLFIRNINDNSIFKA